MRKRTETEVWIDLGLKLGGIVALFASVAATVMVMLASRPYP